MLFLSMHSFFFFFSFLFPLFSSLSSRYRTKKRMDCANEWIECNLDEMRISFCEVSLVYRYAQVCASRRHRVTAHGEGIFLHPYVGKRCDQLWRLTYVYIYIVNQGWYHLIYQIHIAFHFLKFSDYKIQYWKYNTITEFLCACMHVIYYNISMWLKYKHVCIHIHRR